MLEVWIPADLAPTVNTSADTTSAATLRRLTEFAADALDLADRRADLALRALIDDLHADLIRLQEDR